MPIFSKKATTKTLKDETWATLDRIAKSHEEFREDLKKSREEFHEDLKKSREEFDLSIEKSREEFDLGMKKSSEEFDKRTEEFREDLKKSREEFDLGMKKSSEEFDKRMEEFRKNMEKSSEEFREDMKRINGTLGSWSHNIGDFAEDYFINSFEQGKKNFFGEHFDKLKRNLKGDESEDEYDIVLINGEYVGIVEVKFKGHENNIPDILKQANTFRENFPKYKGHKIYLGLASMSFYKELEERCKNEGIAIIKQVGDNVVITDEHLKAF